MRGAQIKDLANYCLHLPQSSKPNLCGREAFVKSLKKKFPSALPEEVRVGLNRPIMNKRGAPIDDAARESTSIFTFDFEKQFLEMLSNPGLYGDPKKILFNPAIHLVDTNPIQWMEESF